MTTAHGRRAPMARVPAAVKAGTLAARGILRVGCNTARAHERRDQQSKRENDSREWGEVAAELHHPHQLEGAREGGEINNCAQPTLIAVCTLL